MAQRRLPKAVFDFVDGGAEDERVVRRNEAALTELAILPRPLNGTTERDHSVELFGERLSGPVLIGPTGLAGMLWPRGEAHRGAGGRQRGHGLHHEPRFDGLDRDARQGGGRAAVDAGLSVSRPRPHQEHSSNARMRQATGRWL